MSELSQAPDISGIEIPMDVWTEPFWAAAAKRRLELPACADCGRFRWPPGPFCPACRSQRTEWLPAGAGRIYSFTVVRERPREGAAPAPVHVPALIEFPDAGGVRLFAAIVDAPLADLCVGAAVTPQWSEAANATVPVFRLS